MPDLTWGLDPSAALSAWGFGKAKQTWLELQANFAFITADEHLHERFASDDVWDAVVGALVARARDLEHTIGPPDDKLAAGRHEGWLHVSCEPTDLWPRAADTGRRSCRILLSVSLQRTGEVCLTA